MVCSIVNNVFETISNIIKKVINIIKKIFKKFVNLFRRIRIMQEIENLKEELKKAQESTQRIEERIKQLEKSSTKRWRAEEDEEFYYVDIDGQVDSCTDYYDEEEDDQYEIGNYFETEEEAEKVADKIKIYARLKDLARKLNDGELIDWTNKDQIKYCIRMKNNTLFQDFNGKYISVGQIYCLDSNFLNEAIKEIGEYDLKKLF